MKKSLTNIEWCEPENYLNINWNTPNSMPTPYKEISHEDFIRLFHCNNYSLNGTNYKQIYFEDTPGKQTYWEVTFYMFFEKCVAVAKQYGYKQHEEKYTICKAYESENTWTDLTTPIYRLRFFRLGCEHEYTETKLGNCWYRHTCKLCGESHEVDSSD